MKKSFLITGVVVLSLLAAGLAIGHGGDSSTANPDHSQDRHEAVEESFENNDYEAWSELMEGKDATRFVDEDNFDTFAEMHEAMEEGDTERAQELRQGLGLHGMRGHCRRR